ncbi:hypothetical protein [Streptomyces sp. NPDC005435]|uniref:hypothetical protein n=1 Tax=Streptomyces sp. NPDC005435 TaxID=3154464 RepID=UPI0034525C62
MVESARGGEDRAACGVGLVGRERSGTLPVTGALAPTLALALALERAPAPARHGVPDVLPSRQLRAVALPHTLACAGFSDEQALVQPLVRTAITTAAASRAPLPAPYRMGHALPGPEHARYGTNGKAPGGS